MEPLADLIIVILQPLTLQCCQALGYLSTPVNSCEVYKAQREPQDRVFEFL